MPFTDNFTGTAGQLLSARTGWAKMGSGTGVPEINASNQLKAPASTSDVAMYGQDTTSTGHYVQANVYAGFPYSGAVSYRSNLAVRATDRNTNISVDYDTGSAAWRIRKDGASQSNWPATFTPGDLVRIEAEGTAVRVFINGTQRLSLTLSTHLASTSVGAMVAGAAASDPVLDNYESGPLVAAAPPTGTRTGRAFDGQSVNYTFSTTGDPTGGEFSITGTAGGAVTQTKALVIDNATDTASVSFDNLVAGGSYTESGNVDGAGGNDVPITGVGSFTVSPIDGSPTDGEEPPPATNPPAPSFTVSRRGRGRARSRR